MMRLGIDLDEPANQYYYLKSIFNTLHYLNSCIVEYNFENQHIHIYTLVDEYTYDYLYLRAMLSDDPKRLAFDDLRKKIQDYDVLFKKKWIVKVKSNKHKQKIGMSNYEPISYDDLIFYITREPYLSLYSPKKRRIKVYQQRISH